MHLSTPELAAALGVDRSPSALASISPAAVEAISEHVMREEGFSSYDRYPWSDPQFWLPEGTSAERSQYFAVGNAINFRFWSMKEGEVVPAAGILSGQRLTGAMYMWRCLRRCLDRQLVPLYDAPFLASLSEEQFDSVFTDDTGSNPLSVGKADRLENLRDLGSILQRSWGGRFYNVVAASGGSLVRFAKLSSTFRAFDDPLFKLTMVNTILHLGSGVSEFDADPLPGIDYHLLKQLLRQGVLIPHPKLTERLAQQQLVHPHEVYELRRAALNAFVDVSARTRMSGEILDNKWWWNRLKCRTSDPVCLDPSTASECIFLPACTRRVHLSPPPNFSRYY